MGLWGITNFLGSICLPGHSTERNLQTFSTHPPVTFIYTSVISITILDYYPATNIIPLPALSGMLYVAIFIYQYHLPVHRSLRLDHESQLPRIHGYFLIAVL